MEEKISRQRYLGVSLFLSLILAYNFFITQSLIIGLSFGLAYLVFYSLIAGSIFISKKGWHLILGLVFILSIIAIVGGSAIYFYQLNDIIFLIILLGIPSALATPYYRIKLKEKISFRQHLKNYLEKFTTRAENPINLALVVSYSFLAAFCFLFLIAGQTTSSIQTPWQVVNSQFFLFYFLASLVLFTYLFNTSRTKLPLILIIVHSLLSFSVALLVYGLGFGFDPFIHQATEKIILQTGTITPKPLYYLGHYSIVIFLSKLTLGSYELIDRFLVPVLAALTLPPSIFYVLSHWFKKNYALVLSASFLAIPFTSYIMSTPQNLANLFFIITILLSLLYYRGQVRVEILYILTLATLIIHPLAGIPLLITIVLLHLYKLLYTSYSQHLSLYLLSSSVFIIFMPLAFLANGSQIALNLPNVKSLIKQSLIWVDKFDLPLNITYLFAHNKSLVALIFIALGLYYLKTHKLLKNNIGYLIAAVIIYLNYLFTKYFITFPNLRDYDTPEFVNRLLTLTFYILLPFFLLGLHLAIKKLWQKDIFTKAFVIFILAGSLSISLYLSYPKLDNYGPAKFFSLSTADIKAVTLIEQRANPNHIVLANQMIGLAAIKEYGFKKYYNNQFYYSMPMGNPRSFYDAYLKMVNETPSRKNVLTVMDEAGVNEAYFVLNNYWRGADKIAEQAKTEADEVYEIDNGAIDIFRYIK